MFKLYFKLLSYHIYYLYIYIYYLYIYIYIYIMCSMINNLSLGTRKRFLNIYLLIFFFISKFFSIPMNVDYEI